MLAGMCWENMLNECTVAGKSGLECVRGLVTVSVSCFDRY